MSQTEAKQQPKTVLHVGCGTPNRRKLHQRFHGPEWTEVRLDIDPGVQPDIVCDMRDMGVIGSKSMDAVWSSHNLEHLHEHEVAVALGEFHRVLKQAGIVLVTLPDLQSACRHVADNGLDHVLYTAPAGPVRPIDVIYGYGPSIARGNTFMTHKTGFTATTLRGHLARAGFSGIRVARKRFDLWAIGHKIGRQSPRRKAPAHG